jgi:hypothetical protein
MVDWLNANTGFFTTILSLVLVIITGYYAIITHKMLKSNEKANNEQTRPYVIAMIESQDSWLNLYIKNIGKRPAHNVKIDFNPQLDNIDNLRISKDEKPHKKLLYQSFMPPNFEVKTTLWFTPNYINTPNVNKTFEVRINYEDLSTLSYSEVYQLDLENYIYGDKSIEYSDNHYYNEISKSLKDIKEVLKGISNKR